MRGALSALVVVATCVAAPALSREKPATTSARARERAAEKKEPLASQRAEAKPIALTGGHVHPVTRPDIPGGTVLLKDGRIEALLGADRSDADWAARGYEVTDVRGRHVYPGLVAGGADGVGLTQDAWAVGSGEEALGRRVADSFNAWDDNVELSVAAGITSALVYRTPITAKSPLSGRAAFLKMSYGEPRGVVLKEGAAIFAAPRLLAPDFRGELRETIEKARERDRNEDGDKDEGVRLLDALARREIPLVVGAGSAGDVAGALDLAKEMDLRIVLYLSTEAWTLADRIAATDTAVVQHVRTSWFKPRSSRRTELDGGWRHDAVVKLVRAGVPVAVLPFQDAPSTGGIAGRDFVNFPLEAAFAQRAGLTAQEALESITIVPARIFGVDDRVGSLEPGKDADVLVTDGDILDYRTFVRTAIVNGKVVYRAEGNRWWKWCIERRDKALSSGSSSTPRELPAVQALDDRRRER